MQQSLVDLQTGQSGIIVDIKGDKGLLSQLGRLGIRIGKKIVKTSAIFSHGPVAIGIDNHQIAVGYGKARRIIIEVNNENNCPDR